MRILLKYILVILIFIVCGSKVDKKDNNIFKIESQSITIADGSDPCADSVDFLLSLITNVKTYVKVLWTKDSVTSLDTLIDNNFSIEHFFTFNNITYNDTLQYKIILYNIGFTDSSETQFYLYVPEKDIESPSIEKIHITAFTNHCYFYVNIDHPAKLKLLYGFSQNYTDTLEIDSALTVHWFKVDSLIADTVYHYTVYLEDNCGNFVQSDWDSIFVTNPYPVIKFQSDTIAGTDSLVARVYVQNIQNLFVVDFQFVFPGDKLIYTNFEKGDLMKVAEYNPIQCVQNPMFVTDHVGAVASWSLLYLDFIYPIGSYMQLPIGDSGNIANFYFKINQCGMDSLYFDTLKVRFLDPLLNEVKGIKINSKLNLQ